MKNNDFRELAHHGILGMRWGIRRERYDPQSGLSRKDEKWAKKNTAKITKTARKGANGELDRYAKELMSDPKSYNSNGKINAATINAYNRKMAKLMSEQAIGLRSPSGKVVQFVAKRSELGVYMALADEGYNMNQLKNGIYGSGRIAYRKTVLDKVNA